MEIFDGLKEVTDIHWTDKEETACMHLCCDCTFYKDVLVFELFYFLFFNYSKTQQFYTSITSRV